jgi:hypothetical protein
MSADGRLPEDIAAEQAYLAELRAQREQATQQDAAARRASLAAQGMLPAVEPAQEVLQRASAASAAPSVAAETLLNLSPELLAQLPPAAREAVELARRERSRRELSGALTSPAVAGTVELNENTWLDGADPAADPAQGEAELERRERAILASVQAELMEGRGGRNGTRFDIAPVRLLDSLLGILFGRRNTW